MVPVDPDWLTDSGRTQLVRFAYLVSGDRELAEDAVQEVLLRLLSRRGPDPWNPRAFVRRCIVNEIASTRRTRVREDFRTSIVAKEADAARFEPNLDHSAVLAALATLSPRERTAVVLRYFEDAEDTVTARVIGCSRGTVRTLIRRALPKLKQQLDIDEGDVS